MKYSPRLIRSVGCRQYSVPCHLNIRKEIEAWDDVGSPTSAWPLVTAVTLTGMNEKAQMRELVETINDIYPAQADQVAVIRRVREAILKSSVLVGFPKGINGLLYLKEATAEPIIKELLQDKPRNYEVQDVDRGYDFFSSIYDRHTDRVLHSMSSTHPLLGPFAIHHLYGPLFSDFTVLSPKDTSIVEVVCCLVAQVEQQAKGHVHGARNLGIPVSRIFEIRDLCCTVLANCQNADAVDKIKGWPWWSKFNSKL